jgi:hypothetical protein
VAPDTPDREPLPPRRGPERTGDAGIGP